MSASTQTIQTWSFAPALGRSQFSGRLAQAAKMLKALGPYAAIELIVPGGTLVLLVLWLYRRYRPAFENFVAALVRDYDPRGNAQTLTFNSLAMVLVSSSILVMRKTRLMRCTVSSSLSPRPDSG